MTDSGGKARIPPLLNWLDAKLPELSLRVSSKHDVRREYAAAALVRCRNLYQAIVILRMGDRRDILGLPARAIVETWLVGLWLLFGGSDPNDERVLLELGVAYTKGLKAMSEKVRGPGADESVPAMKAWDELVETANDPDLPKYRLKYKDIAEKLVPLMEARGPTLEPNAREIYNRIYRAESAASAHAGLGSFHLYIRHSSESRVEGLILDPEPPFPNQEALAAIITRDLAIHVLEAFGFDVKDLPNLEESHRGSGHEVQ